MRKVTFTYPLSDSRKWQGQLHIEANVDGREAEVTRLVHEDHNGKKSDITYLMDEWMSDSLYPKLCEMSVEHAAGVVELEESDYTLINS